MALGIGVKPSVFCTIRAPGLSAPLIASSIVAFAPAAKMETKATSVTPTISAEAVTAVRPGWRTVFSRARRPIRPGSGRPIAAVSGGTSLGLSTATPRKTSSAPSPTSVTPAPPNRPAARASAPSAPMTTPAGVTKRWPRDGGSTAPSRSAATGGTCVARMAGSRPLTSVTSVPMSSDTTIVRVSTTLPADGRSAPIALNSARRPGASARPANSPTIEPSAPMTRPSASTCPITWRRDAPSVRSSANSRMRCATVIENVLKMMNAPTNSEIAAKASSAVRRKLSSSRMSREFLSAFSLPVRTATVAGETRRIWSRSCAGSTPGFAATEISLSWPAVPFRR